MERIKYTDEKKKTHKQTKKSAANSSKSYVLSRTPFYPVFTPFLFFCSLFIKKID